MRFIFAGPYLFALVCTYIAFAPATAIAQQLTPELRALAAKEDARYQNHIITAEVDWDGGFMGGGKQKVAIEGVLILPDPERFKAPYPLAVFSHGSQAYRSPSTVQKFDADSRGHRIFSHAWTLQGYALFFPLRKGFTRKDGISATTSVNRTEPINCGNRTSQEEGLISAKTDVRALVSALGRTRQDIDMTKVLLIGHSRGGFISLSLAADEMPGAVGVVNYSGGWHWEPCPEGSSFSSDYFKVFSEKVKVPVVSLYGDKEEEHPIHVIEETRLAALRKIKDSRVIVIPGGNHSQSTWVVNWFIPVRGFLEDLNKR